MKRNTLQSALLMLIPYVLFATDHLLISELVLQPADGEYILITNPTSSSINLSDYYLTDATDTTNQKYYYNLPTGMDYWSGGSTDFIARFPDIAIAAGASLTIATESAAKYSGEYGHAPDLVLKADFLPAVDGQSTIGGAPFKFNAAETIVLFYWDGTSTTVNDVEYLVWGVDSTAASGHMIDKTGVSGYLPDTPITEQSFLPRHENGFKLIRNSDEGTETAAGGNGITGHDETSENLADTWSVVDLTIVKPEISNILVSPDDPETTEDITISADITDAAGVSSVTLTYTFPSETGTPQDVLMLNTAGDTYAYTIPATNAEGTLNYFITVVNTSGLTETSAIGGIEIADPPPPVTMKTIWENYGEYEGQSITLSGVIAIGSGITRSDRTEAYIQDYSGYGLVISAGGLVNPPLVKGDSILIEGLIDEYNGAIQIQEFTTTLLDTDVPVSNVAKISTAQLNTLEWEGRFVEVSGIVASVAHDIGGGSNITLEDFTGDIVSEKDKQITLRVWDSTNLFGDSLATALLQAGSKVSVRGLAGQYNGEGQLVLAYASDVQEFPEGDDGDGSTVLSVAPFPFDPLRGEKIQYTFSFPGNSHITLRVFDLSGRFVTTLFDGYRTPPLEITNYWKGRTETYSVVPPGTYIMHLETINRMSGETRRDTAPVVVAARTR